MKSLDAMTALKDFVGAHRTQREAAGRLGISQAFLNDILHGKRGLPDSILPKLGLRQIVVKS